MEVFQKGWKPPVQKQSRPGRQNALEPPPVDDTTADGKPYKPGGKLSGKTALVTGADSGIGRSVALLFALEGADLTMVHIKHMWKSSSVPKLPDANSKCWSTTDLTPENACQELIRKHVEFHESHALDILICNHGTQKTITDLTNLPSEQWLNTFDTNIHSFFFLTKAALPHIPRGGSIVFNASINSQVGHPHLVDYTATKGAIVGLARALSNQIVGDKGIRVNAVAPGPIWTPPIPATMADEHTEIFGITTPIGRPGQPIEVATSFVFLASADSSYMSGQVLIPNGGVVIA